MRILAAIVLSVTGAVTAFLGVLTALDDHPSGVASPDLALRLQAFAAPDLAASQAHIAVIGAQPPSVARFAAPAMLAESRWALPESAAPVRAAFVPPLPRRKPVDPADPAAVAIAEPKSTAPAIADAGPVRAKVPPTASQPIDTSTRSALGGPRPGAGKTP